MPPPIGPAGMPEYRPEDAFFIPAFICDHNNFDLLEKLRAELPAGKEFSPWHGRAHHGVQFENAECCALRLDSAPPTLREIITSP